MSEVRQTFGIHTEYIDLLHPEGHGHRGHWREARPSSTMAWSQLTARPNLVGVVSCVWGRSGFGPGAIEAWVISEREP